MECVQTENTREQLVADSQCSKEAPFHRMNDPVNQQLLPVKQQSDEEEFEGRLRTFAEWPYDDIISRKKLAKAGFFYKGNGDEVQCYSCGVKVRGWKPSDIAVRKHQELFPNCSYIASIFNKASKRHDSRLIGNVLNSASQQNFSSSQNMIRSRLSSVETQASALRTALRTFENSHESVQNIPPTSISTPINLPSQNQNMRTCNGVVSTERYPDFEKMKSEEERLNTFNFGWPVMSPKPCDLARVGFFFLLEADRVQCAFCRGVVSSWEPTDDPLREHARHFAFCPFIMGRDVGNIPSSKNSPPNNYGEDVCGYTHWGNSGPENGYGLEKKLEKLENFGVKLHHGPKHPSQASKDARYRSFVGWPTSSPIQPKALVEAGFFYIGIQDYTRCFYCDGGLCNWEANDDPWEEHAKWFQHCAYVRLNKGDAWVEACLKKGNTMQKPQPQASQEECSKISATSSVIDIHSKVEELMNSGIITSAVELGIFPVDVIKAALLKRIQTVGSNFSTHDELCDAVFKLQDEMEKTESTTSTTAETKMEISTNTGGISTENTSETVVPTTTARFPLIPPTTVPKVTVPPVEDLIKEQRLCKICMDKEIGVLFLPCGHLMSCVECGPAMTICPFCREKIRGTVRAFLT